MRGSSGATNRHRKSVLENSRLHGQRTRRAIKADRVAREIQNETQTLLIGVSATENFPNGSSGSDVHKVEQCSCAAPTPRTYATEAGSAALAEAAGRGIARAAAGRDCRSRWVLAAACGADVRGVAGRGVVAVGMRIDAGTNECAHAA